MNKKIVGAILVGVMLLAGCNKAEDKKLTWTLTYGDNGQRVTLTEEQNTQLYDYTKTELSTNAPVNYQPFTDDYQALINVNEDVDRTGTTYLVTVKGEIIVNSYIYNQQDNYYKVSGDSQLGQLIYSLIGDNQYIDVRTNQDGTLTYYPAPYVPTPNPDAFTLSPEAQARQDEIDATRETN